jgi:hypothetical protein
MSSTVETTRPTSKKEAIRLILALREKSQQLEARIENLEYTNRSFKSYANIGTASTIGVVTAIDAS